MSFYPLLFSSPVCSLNLPQPNITQNAQTTQQVQQCIKVANLFKVYSQRVHTSVPSNILVQYVLGRNRAFFECIGNGRNEHKIQTHAHKTHIAQTHFVCLPMSSASTGCCNCLGQCNDTNWFGFPSPPPSVSLSRRFRI